MKQYSEIIIYQSESNETRIQTRLHDETVWFNRHQMADLFDRDIKTIGKHITNILLRENLIKIQLSQNLRQLLKMVKQVINKQLKKLKMNMVNIEEKQVIGIFLTLTLR